MCRRRHNSDNGSEFLNHGVIDWAGDLGIYFTRGRPYKKNDEATIEYEAIMTTQVALAA